MTPYRWKRLRAALNGRRGYAEQQAAWDAVMPGWREPLELVLRISCGPPLTSEQREMLDRTSEALRADNRRLAPSWSKLLFQAMYRDCPQLGGWFPA